MSDEWGPWITHDGEGCPPYLIGKVVRVEVEWTADDTDGNRLGDRACVAFFVDEGYIANLPDWWVNLAGTVARNPDGSVYSVPKIIRFALRNPPAIALLREIARNPSKARELEDA